MSVQVDEGDHYDICEHMLAVLETLSIKRIDLIATNKLTLSDCEKYKEKLIIYSQEE